MNRSFDSLRPTRSRLVFLGLLGLGITVAFYWVIWDFVVSLLLAAVLAGMAFPFYDRLCEKFGGRKTLAAGTTVALSLVLVVVPLVLFVGVLVNEALTVSAATGAWITENVGPAGELQQKLATDPHFARLMPYQDQIVAKITHLASSAGSFVAHGLAVGARGTAKFFLLVFVLLFGVFTFLTTGREMLDSVLRFTPLTDEDKKRLLSTFSSVGRATIKGTLVIGIIQGGLAGLSFWVAGIDGALFWGVVMAVLSIIPGLGTAIVWVPTVAFLALDGQIAQAVGVGLWCAVVVGSVDNFLRPVLVGKDIEMPDLLVMLTTLGGLTLFGAVGIILGPLIGALYLTIWKMWGRVIDEEKAIEQQGPSIENGGIHG